MRVALYGGSFNPPTLAHRAVVCQTLATCSNVDRVWITPALKHAYGKALVDYSIRMHLCESLFQSIPCAHVSLLESELNSSTGSTYELLNYAKMSPDVDAVSLIVGQDQAEQIDDHWIYGKALIQEFSIIVLPRGDTSSVSVPWLNLGPHTLLPALPEEFRSISSTQARSALAAKAKDSDLLKLMSPETIKLCNKLGLYHD